ncbi:uncharacterized protein RHOBADRAFT_54634, partial [Rhodotorula graminis WP1]
AVQHVRQHGQHGRLLDRRTGLDHHQGRRLRLDRHPGLRQQHDDRLALPALVLQRPVRQHHVVLEHDGRWSRRQAPDRRRHPPVAPCRRRRAEGGVRRQHARRPLDHDGPLVRGPDGLVGRALALAHGPAHGHPHGLDRPRLGRDYGRRVRLVDGRAHGRDRPRGWRRRPPPGRRRVAPDAPGHGRRDQGGAARPRRARRSRLARPPRRARLDDDGDGPEAERDGQGRRRRRVAHRQGHQEPGQGRGGPDPRQRGQGCRRGALDDGRDDRHDRHRRPHLLSGRRRSVLFPSLPLSPPRLSLPLSPCTSLSSLVLLASLEQSETQCLSPLL